MSTVAVESETGHESGRERVGRIRIGGRVGVDGEGGVRGDSVDRVGGNVGGGDGVGGVRDEGVGGHGSSVESDISDGEGRSQGGLERKKLEDVVVGGVDGKGYFGSVASKEVRVVVGEDRRAAEIAPLFDGEQAGNRRGHSHGEGNGRAGGGAAVEKDLNHLGDGVNVAAGVVKTTRAA